MSIAGTGNITAHSNGTAKVDNAGSGDVGAQTPEEDPRFVGALGFFEDVYVTCRECEGRRYRPDVRQVAYQGRDISQVLQMTVDEAIPFFRDQDYSSGVELITLRVAERFALPLAVLSTTTSHSPWS